MLSRNRENYDFNVRVTIGAFTATESYLTTIANKNLREDHTIKIIIDKYTMINNSFSEKILSRGSQRVEILCAVCNTFCDNGENSFRASAHDYYSKITT